MKVLLIVEGRYKVSRRSTYLVGIASEPRGSWKWQDAYHQSFHGMKRRKKDGKLIWQTIHKGPKRSEPQLRGAHTDIGWRSAHNKPVTKKDIIAIARGKIRRGEASPRDVGRYINKAKKLVKGWPR